MSKMIKTEISFSPRITPIPICRVLYFYLTSIYEPLLPFRDCILQPRLPPPPPPPPPRHFGLGQPSAVPHVMCISTVLYLLHESPSSQLTDLSCKEFPIISSYLQLICICSHDQFTPGGQIPGVPRDLKHHFAGAKSSLD